MSIHCRTDVNTKELIQKAVGFTSTKHLNPDKCFPLITLQTIQVFRMPHCCLYKDKEQQKNYINDISLFH